MVKFMHIFQGESVSKGKVSGNLLYMEHDSFQISKSNTSDIDRELVKFQMARADALNQLQSLYEKALVKVGESDAKIFVIQQMMIHENGFTSAIRKMITEDGVSAHYAVFCIAQNHIKTLKSTKDEYIRARTFDVQDISQRVIRNLTRTKSFKTPKGKNLIIYKHTIMPSEMIELAHDNIIAAITCKDSCYSHSAILARSLKLPIITDISSDIAKYDGKKITVDADSGKISIHTK